MKSVTSRHHSIDNFSYQGEGILTKGNYLLVYRESTNLNAYIFRTSCSILMASL